MIIYGTTTYSPGRRLTTHLSWTGYGLLSTALIGADGYLVGVAHVWRPDAIPWFEPSDYWQGPACPAQGEVGNPAMAWHRARLREQLASYEAVKDLAERWPR